MDYKREKVLPLLEKANADEAFVEDQVEHVITRAPLGVVAVPFSKSIHWPRFRAGHKSTF